jgi:hypothetical protein
MSEQNESNTNTLIHGLEWAEPAQDIDPKVSLDDLLRGLRLLATDAAREQSHTGEWNAKTPASLQVIESGALAITRNLTSLAKKAGGWSALIVLASGGLATILKVFDKSNISNSIIVTLFGGAFVLVSAIAIALALLVKGDLQARGGASAARYQARGQVTTAFLQATASLHDASSPQTTTSVSPAQPSILWVRPMILVGEDPNPWRPVLAYSKISEGDPPQERTLYFIQVDPGQQPQWKGPGEVDGWKISASAPRA